MTAVEFDATGDYLAVGDKAGRICIFESSAASPSSPPPPPHPDRRPPLPPPLPIEYRFYTEFQSHEPEFDCLKSLEIEERINAVRWCRRSGSGLFLLAANDKTVKYWKVHERKIRQRQKEGGGAAPTAKRGGAGSVGGFVSASQDGLTLPPRVPSSQSVTTATPRRVYSGAHSFHINSLALNSDAETFISADDLRIQLWSLEVSNESFTLVDLKPFSLEELTEVITACAFHPSHCNLMMYSTSRGSIRLVDLRDSALGDHHAKQLESEDELSSKSFFSEITASISDCSFSGSEGRYVLSRDYLTLRLWDLHMETRPLLSLPVHDFLRPHLEDLYENDCIFDKFQLSANAAGSRGVTGSYNNHFVVWEDEAALAAGAGGGAAGAGFSQLTIEALKDGPRRKDAVAKAAGAGGGGGEGSAGKRGRGGAGAGGVRSTAAAGESYDVQRMDFGKKALHVAWHPHSNALAVAGLNRLFIYQGVSAHS